MAGGKETPRQKMIGMMYLVLTALLALQVSNAVLEKFAIINVTLSGLITEGEKKSNMVRWEHHMLASTLALTMLSTPPKSLFCYDLSQQIHCPLSVPGNSTF